MKGLSVCFLLIIHCLGIVNADNKEENGSLDFKTQALDLRIQPLDLSSQDLDLRIPTLDLNSQALDLRIQTVDLSSQAVDLRIQPKDLRSRPLNLRTQIMFYKYRKKYDSVHALDRNIQGMGIKCYKIGIVNVKKQF